MKELSWPQFGGPLLVAVLALIPAVIYGLILWISDKRPSTEGYWFFGLAFAPLAIFGWAEKIKEACLSSANSSLGFPDIELGHLYTHSFFYFFSYELAKSCLAAWDVVFVPAIIVLIFSWFGFVSSFVTTIIIFLLLVIIRIQVSARLT